MKDSENDHRGAVALFRHALVVDLARLPPGAKGLRRQIEQKAARHHEIPDGRPPRTTRARVAPETLRHWLERQRQGGFDALLPKARADRGQPRTLPPAVRWAAPTERLVSVKEASPGLSVQLVIREARAFPDVPDDLPLAPSTVHRLLAREGLMRKNPAQPGDCDRRRFAFEHAGELWTGDVMHGPSVRTGDRAKRKTYLIAFLDDATRVIPHAAFALSESTRDFLPLLKQALLRRGLPQRLCGDNGAN